MKNARPVAAQFCVNFLKPEMLHIYRQITALEAFRPVVLTQKRENAARFPFGDVIELPRPATRWLRRWWMKQVRGRPVRIYRSEARCIADELRRIDAKVLHVYFGHIGVYLLPLLEMRALPAVLSFHGADVMVDMENAAHRAGMTRALELADLVLARSQSLVDGLAALGCPRGKIRIHRTGIPLDDFPFAERAAPPDDAWHFLQACRLIEKKGLPTALRAFAKFAAAHPKSIFTIAGEGAEEARLRELAAGLGIADRVRFAGFVSQAELCALFAQAHFFIHPSETGPDGNQEGVPNAMLEAMATGLPVLATRHGGIPEAVEDGVGGVLVAERDADGLAKAALELAADDARRGAMGAAAADALRAGFEQRTQVRALEGFYSEITQA
jgi:colanic acid/amylovoran biosynthesis glycosyltransferase